MQSDSVLLGTRDNARRSSLTRSPRWTWAAKKEQLFSKYNWQMLWSKHKHELLCLWKKTSLTLKIGDITGNYRQSSHQGDLKAAFSGVRIRLDKSKWRISKGSCKGHSLTCYRTMWHGYWKCEGDLGPYGTRSGGGAGVSNPTGQAIKCTILSTTF